MTKNPPSQANYYQGPPQGYSGQPPYGEQQPQYGQENYGGESYDQPTQEYQRFGVADSDRGPTGSYNYEPQHYYHPGPSYRSEPPQYGAPSPYEQPVERQPQYGAPPPERPVSATLIEEYYNGYPPNASGPEVDAFKSHFDRPNERGYEQNSSDYSGTPNPYNQASDYPQPEAQEGERGLMGALGGAAAGGYAGHKMGKHGIVGAVGGAIAGSLLQDEYKKHRDENKQHHQQPAWGNAPSLPPAPAGNFHASSADIKLEDGRYLVAVCRDKGGRHCRSRLDLNDCLTNNNGHFGWAQGGNFRASAKHVKLTADGQYLEAELADVEGRWRADKIWLTENISNDNGRLLMI